MKNSSWAALTGHTRKKGKYISFIWTRQREFYRNDCRMTEELTLKHSEMQKVLMDKNFSEYYEKVFEILKSNRNESTDREGLNYFFDKDVQSG